MSKKSNLKPTIFQAELWLKAKVIPQSTEGRIVLDLGREALEVAVYPKLWPNWSDFIATLHPSDIQTCKLWIRTGPKGKLRQEVCVLRQLSTDPIEPHFVVQGKVKTIGSPEGYLKVTIYPSPRGELQHPFVITMLADTAILKQIVKGQSLRVYGSLTPDRRLIATSVEEIHLPKLKYPLHESVGALAR